ncbi:HGxxPAAW family protein [Austwickia chelonae]|uniref:HGxxPAAW family protein n=1 Tax=Austwickia chelonae TaxID=100225 RepID=UPI000E21E7DB|nr:HGxxPAAW family protein [Austwickia chelonae]
MSGTVSHGNTPAAWVGTAFLLLGSAVVSVGVIVNVSWLWIIGTILCVVGVVAWVGMNRAGMNQDMF